MWQKNDFLISTNRTLLDFEVIHNFISTQSYWGIGRSREAMEKAMLHSVYCFGVYHTKGAKQNQVGFARVVSDLTTFGYIADVFILSDYRGKGLGKWLIQTIVNHPELKNLKKVTLFTKTPEFYEPIGFKSFEQTNPSKFMKLETV